MDYIDEFAKTIIDAGIPAMYGILRGPGETDEQMLTRLKIFLYEGANRTKQFGLSIPKITRHPDETDTQFLDRFFEGRERPPMAERFNK